MDPSWSAVFPLVAYNVWKYYNCTHCIDNAWSGLSLYYKMLANNYSVSTHTTAIWGDWNPAYPEMRTLILMTRPLRVLISLGTLVVLH